MLETVLGADIGSSLTRLAGASDIVSDETRAALDPGNSLRVLAVGERGRSLLGASEAYPVRGGISDISLTAVILRRLALGFLKRRTLLGVSAIVAVSGAAGEMARSAFGEVCAEAGFRNVRLVNALAAGAIGAGVDISSPKAHMIVDIGRETVSCAVTANGGVVSETVSGFGSVAVDRRLMAFFAEEQGLLITSRTAERLKKSLGSPTLSVSTRDSMTGFSAVKRINASVLREAAIPALDTLCGEVVKAIDRVPPDAAADLVDNGIVLIGGGAEQYGIEGHFERRLGIPVRRAANARMAVVLGLQEIIRGECGVAPGGLLYPISPSRSGRKRFA